MRRMSGSRTCQPLSTATCGVSRKRTNSRFRGLAASWRDSSIVFGSERCSCGPAGLIRDVFERLHRLWRAVLEHLEVLSLQVLDRHPVPGRVNVHPDEVGLGPERRRGRLLRLARRRLRGSAGLCQRNRRCRHRERDECERTAAHVVRSCLADVESLGVRSVCDLFRQSTPKFACMIRRRSRLILSRGRGPYKPRRRADAPFAARYPRAAAARLLAVGLRESVILQTRRAP